MRSDIACEFLFDARTVQLNHASYGSPTKATWDRLGSLRRRLELDPAGNLGSHVVSTLTPIAGTVRRFLGVSGGSLAFTLNTTEAHETVARSLRAARGQFSIAYAADEYESMKSTWVDASQTTDGSRRIRVEQSVHVGSVLEADVVLCSVVASSTARHASPTMQRATWATVIDASHAPGHVSLEPWTSVDGPAAIIGSLHKWLPAVRPAGFLWLSEDWPTTIRPAIASLRDQDGGALDLLSWRGTWDTTPHLVLPLAIEQWQSWRDDGLIEAAERLADDASQMMADSGYSEINMSHTRAPRLRSFIIQRRSVEQVKTILSANGINAWVGLHDDQTVLRLALNVYNDSTDVERVVSTLATESKRR